MDALLFRRRGEWLVGVLLDGEEIDLAGPFDDEYDAVMAARRISYGIGTVDVLPEVP